MKLDVENILVALPGFIEHEVVLGRRVPVKDRLMEHGFVPHRVEHAFQELEELTAPLRHNLKLDEICHWHRSAPWIEIGVSPICNAPGARSNPCPRGSKSDSEGLIRSTSETGHWDTRAVQSVAPSPRETLALFTMDGGGQNGHRQERSSTTRHRKV
jgi:hypothetical protein